MEIRAPDRNYCEALSVDYLYVDHKPPLNRVCYDKEIEGVTEAGSKCKVVGRLPKQNPRRLVKTSVDDTKPVVTLEVKCKPPFVLSNKKLGVQKVYCNTERYKWEYVSKPRTAQDVRCAHPSEGKVCKTTVWDGLVSISLKSKFGDVATIKCAAGYGTSGTKSALCTASGEFEVDGTPLASLGKVCPEQECPADATGVANSEVVLKATSLGGGTMVRVHAALDSACLALWWHCVRRRSAADPRRHSLGTRPTGRVQRRLHHPN